jgi:hypothetical protein
MPLYRYESPHGQSVERLIYGPPPRVIQIKGVFFRRAAVHSFAVKTRATPTQGDYVLKGYYDQEQRQGSRFRSRHAAAKIKAAWKDSEPIPENGAH